MPISAKPDVCYELSDGTDAAGLGPTLTGGAYTTGALDNGSNAQSASALGVDLTGSFTVGFWRNITAGVFGVEDQLANILMSDDDYAWGFSLSANDSADSLVVSFNNTNTEEAYVVGVVAEGWRYFQAVRTGTSVQLYVDNVAFGSPATVTTFAGSAGVSIENFSHAGRLDQFSARSAAYGTDDRAYLLNGGTPIPYASMSTAGGGAGARAFHLFRMMQGE